MSGIHVATGVVAIGPVRKNDSVAIPGQRSSPESWSVRTGKETKVERTANHGNVTMRQRVRWWIRIGMILCTPMFLMSDRMIFREITRGQDATNVDPELPTFFENGLGMRFRLIPSGRFMMGSPESEEGRWSDETLHEVILTRPFYTGVYEVTQREWETVMGDNPSCFSSTGEYRNSVRENTARHPVENVSWENCREFIGKLNAQYGKELQDQFGADWEYSLPTEAQWEYACRAGHDGPYDGESDPDATSWYGNNSGDVTHQVGTKEPNAWGLHDMRGNVCEWCADHCDWNEGVR
ncbi:MAG: formylglycine-generating enzyme family protein, partial [Planctomycetia bacterium]|nr:formylglycine-generating enzyme family protein [Planctomycetia bacterium]